MAKITARRDCTWRQEDGDLDQHHHHLHLRDPQHGSRGGASYAAVAGGSQAQGPRGQGGQVPNLTYQSTTAGCFWPTYSLSINWKAVKPTAKIKDLVDFLIKDLKVQASDLRAVSVEHVTGLLILQLATREAFQPFSTRASRKRHDALRHSEFPEEHQCPWRPRQGCRSSGPCSFTRCSMDPGSHVQ